MKVYTQKILFFLLLLWTSCQQKYTTVNHLWVGTTRSVDMTIPYPYFIHHHNNMTTLVDYKGSVLDSLQSNPVFNTDDTLNFKSSPMKIIHKEETFMNAFELNDTLRFPIHDGRISWKFRARFEKALKGKKNLKAKINTSIIGKTFICPSMIHNPNSDLDIKKYLSFDRDSLTTTYEYTYQNQPTFKEKHKRPLTFVEIDGQHFFSENVAIGKNPQLLYQILDISSQGITLRYFEENEENISDFKIVKNSPITGDIPEFNQCFDGFQGEYYFYSNGDITYQHGNEYLVKKIAKNSPKTDFKDGYINVHFSINCEGKVGHIGLEQMDFQYQKTAFSYELVAHIINEVVQLKDWPKIKPLNNWEYKDVHAFLMFKIENGKITDLCP